MHSSSTASESRRRTLRALLALPLLPAAACSKSDDGPAGETPSPAPAPAPTPAELKQFLKPAKIHKSSAAPDHVIDAHAHFFNASDVTIKGYMTGPLAHASGGIVGELLKALAPLAEWMGNTAPDAADEIQYLAKLSNDPIFIALAQEERLHILEDRRNRYMQEMSVRVFQQMRTLPDFVRLYNETQKRVRKQSRTQDMQAPALNETSLSVAMRAHLKPHAAIPPADVAQALSSGTDGVLAFVGYMLSYRWMNLLAYQRAYSTGDSSFGVDQVVGALVDFDHWLTPPARTPPDDQIRLHQLLSQLSGGYMRPLVAYNPWSDVLDNGKTLERTLTALDNHGFVCVKIYPPNGFRPYGNTLSPPIPTTPGMPSAADLDQVLLRFWDECSKRNAPVMAHTSDNMGSDDAHSAVAGPVGWQALIAARGPVHPARVNFGHFGGHSPQDNWIDELAHMMATPEGAALYGDLAYWIGLRCPQGLANCAARQKLASTVKASPVVAQRLMYGSDWLMLSVEGSWDYYPFDILAALPEGLNPKAVFADNARNCYPALARAT